MDDRESAEADEVKRGIRLFREGGRWNVSVYRVVQHPKLPWVIWKHDFAWTSDKTRREALNGVAMLLNRFQGEMVVCYGASNNARVDQNDLRAVAGLSIAPWTPNYVVADYFRDHGFDLGDYGTVKTETT